MEQHVCVCVCVSLWVCVSLNIYIWIWENVNNLVLIVINSIFGAISDYQTTISHISVFVDFLLILPNSCSCMLKLMQIFSYSKYIFAVLQLIKSASDRIESFVILKFVWRLQSSCRPERTLCRLWERLTSLLPLLFYFSLTLPSFCPNRRTYRGTTRQHGQT